MFATSLKYFFLFDFKFLFLTQSWLALIKWFLCLILMVLNNIVPLLVCIAFFVVSERKFLAAIQRRFGPNRVGFWGLLQAVADGFKLINKEILVPTRANFYLYFTAPVMSLFLALAGWGFIPLSQTSNFLYDDYSILILLALSSLNVYTVIVAGWSSNSKYSFLGALRSSAQMISYEISISIILIPVFLNSNSLNLIKVVNAQENIWFIGPLLPLAVMFFVSMIAETNRAPFDLPEAEAELVAGFNLEYSSIVFAFFFLGEYSNMILMSSLFCILFLGGWNPILGLDFLGPYLWFALKTVFICVLYVHVRGNLPRYRYDQLMYIGWKNFLPMSLSFVVLYIIFLFVFDAIPFNSFEFLPVKTLSEFKTHLYITNNLEYFSENLAHFVQYKSY